MPQMFPLNWTTLFMVFSLQLLALLTFTYFFYHQPTPMHPLLTSNPINKWLW